MLMLPTGSSLLPATDEAPGVITDSAGVDGTYRSAQDESDASSCASIAGSVGVLLPDVSVVDVD